MTANRSKEFRIGCGSAYADDRVDMAVDMVERGNLDFLCMDGLAERTLALAVQRKHRGTGMGYDTRIPEMAERLFPIAAEQGVRVVTNMGAADPVGAARFLAAAPGLSGQRIAAITGDDVVHGIAELDPIILDLGVPLSELDREVVAANAYIGAESIVEALDNDADIVIGGRLADPSLYVGPIMHHFRIDPADWKSIGAATAIGHLLECGTFVTGGNFADPPYRDVPSHGNPSLPYADVGSDLNAVLGKLPDTGGLLSVETAKMQLGYEIHDPCRYLTPDVAADFSWVQFEAVGDAVAVRGAGGTERPTELKCLIAVDDGYIGEGQVSFAGIGALDRATLGERIVRAEIESRGLAGRLDDLRYDLLGVNSLHDGASPSAEPYEVHLRVAARSRDRGAVSAAAALVWDLQLIGPAGTCGHRKEVKPVIGMYSALIPRATAQPTVTYFNAGDR